MTLAAQAPDWRRKALHLNLAQLYLSLIELIVATDLVYKTPTSERPAEKS